MITRRQFIWAAVTAAGGLAVGTSVKPGLQVAQRMTAADVLGSGGWIEINADGTVLVRSTLTEMGQGPWLTLAQIVAEELDVPLPQVRVAMASSWRAYQAPVGFFTGGSTSTRRLYTGMRTIAAAAREMLVASAAETWGVSIDQCSTADGRVMHAASGRSSPYPQLFESAARRTPPAQPTLKKREQWRVLGQSVASPELSDLVSGRTRFGMDLQLPDMLVATVALAPLPGAVLEHFDRAAASASPGVLKIVDLPEGIAIVAQHYWQAQRALTQAAPRWRLLDIDSAKLREQLLQMVAEAAQPINAQSQQVLSATYDAPLLLHAQLEPLNATARVGRLGVEIWAPTQVQGGMQNDVASALGIWSHRVTVHTPRVGGGFGRRLETDYGVVAALVARQFDVPVKVVWSREEDSRQGRFRPMAAARFEAQLAEDGAIQFLQVSVASLDKYRRLDTLKKMPYAIGELKASYVGIDTPIRTGSWRSVDASQNIFFRESFIDECAEACKKDPLAYRIELLPNNARARRVLTALEKSSDWHAAQAQGRHLGVAFNDGFESIIALAVELDAGSDGDWKISRIFVVVDCGIALNPDGIRAQIEGGVLFGLSAVLREMVTYREGQQLELNYDTYHVLRMADAPDIVVEILETPEAPVGGIGEVGTPVIGPALANALCAATGFRPRSLPLAKFAEKMVLA